MVHHEVIGDGTNQLATAREVKDAEVLAGIADELRQSPPDHILDKVELNRTLGGEEVWW
jgi:hypothetical protein